MQRRHGRQFETRISELVWFLTIDTCAAMAHVVGTDQHDVNADTEGGRSKPMILCFFSFWTEPSGSGCLIYELVTHYD